MWSKYGFLVNVGNISLFLCRHLGSQLCELEKLIDKMMIAEFSTYSHSDLNRPLEDDCQILEEVCPLNSRMKLISLLSVIC